MTPFLLAAAKAPVQEIKAPHVDWSAIAPESSVAAASLLIVMLMALSHRWPRLRSASLPVAVVGLAVAGVFLQGSWSDVTTYGSYQAIRGTVAVDGFAVFLKLLVLASVFLGLLVAHGYLRREGLDGAAYHALVLLSGAGMMMMASANDLVVVFLSLEVLSIALYALCAYHTRRAESQEAGIKYFILGAFSSAVFLYGIAFVYGATGTTLLTGIARFLASTTLLDNGAMLVGVVLLLVGLGFKIAAVPFHMWTPDVYEGAPTPVVSFMAAGAKVAGFAALLRVFVSTLVSLKVDWQPLVWVLAVATMVAGSMIAIVQRDVKRMLAYSSIAHAGFILIGVQVATNRGVSASLAYLFAYTFIVVGTFGVVTVVSRRGDVGHDLDDYRGLAASQPVLAGLLTLFLLAQAGIPLTSGFVAKLSVFSAAADGREWALVLVGVLTSVVAAFIYLRLLVAMYLAPTQPDEPAPRRVVTIDAASGTALAVAAALTIVMGVLPQGFLHFADRARLLLG